MSLLIERAWRDFEIEVLPIDAPDVQKTETRRAFYQGAIAMWCGLMSRRDAGEELGAIKAEIDVEIAQFMEDLASGRA